MVQPAGAFLHSLYGVARSPARTREQVVEFQNRRLRWVVQSAYERVAYYRRLFDEAGITPADIRTIEDLHKIPLTSRADIQSQRPEDVCAKGVRPEKLVIHRTSGSTGAPLVVRRQWLEERIPLLYRRLSNARRPGVGFLPRRATIRFGRREKRRPLQRLLRRRLLLDWDLPKEELVERLARFRPHVIGGPPALLSRLADEMTESDRERFRLEYVYSYTETLSPEMREDLERAFGAPVRETYGSHEMVFIGAECPLGGPYHLCEESVIGEVLRDGRPVEPGEEGEMVCTALNSFAMPFLRYRQGDLVIRGPDSCACGAPYKTLLRVQGRLIDIFRFPNGLVVHPYTFGRTIRDSELNVRRFQVMQEERDRIRVRVVSARHPSEAELRAVASRIEQQIPGAATVCLELAEDIQPGPGGKFNPYITYERLSAWRAASM